MNTALSDQGKMGRFRRNNLVQAWLVLLLAVCFGAALAGVHLKLGPVIEANKMNETLAQVPELILGKELAAKMAAENQDLSISPKTISVERDGRKRYFTVYEARYQDDLRGYVVKTGGQGYADRIELLLGLNADLDSISGLFVLEQKETPGLGNKIIESKWRSQFLKQKVSPPLKVTKDGAAAPGEIDAVTGATISSRAVTAIVNNAISALKEPLSRGEK